MTGLWHDPDGVHDDLWVDVLQRLVDAGTAPVSPVTTGLDAARLWPALVALFATGVSSVRRDREGLLIRMATRPQGRPRLGTSESMPVSQLLHPNRLIEGEWVNAMPRWNGGLWIYPASHLLKADIRRFVDDLVAVEDQYIEAFHGYEYRLGLIQERQAGTGLGYRALSGEYVGETGWTRGEVDKPFAEVSFFESADRSRNWPWFDFLGLDVRHLDEAFEQHRDTLRRHKRYG